MKNEWGKKIIYWGIGKIGRYCLDFYPEIEPLFFVDSHSSCRLFKEKIIRYPEEIDNWMQYYVIITIKLNDARIEIENFLEKKGMHKGSDFCTYEQYFPCPNFTFEESVHLADIYMKEHPEVEKPMLLKVPLEGIRNNKVYMNFLSNYFAKREPGNCIIFSPLEVMSDEMASKKYNCPVIPMPNRIVYEEVKTVYISKLTENEMKWIKEVENRKVYANRERKLYEAEYLYCYYKSIIEIIKPSKIIFWSNWSSESYIVGHLADIYGIPHAYMEYGWIPGTYQVDQGGIAGQSEYAVNPQILKNIEVKNTYNIEKIKEYVRDNKLDTRSFADTESDNAALQQIDKTKKTIFLVGMDDCGMRMNPKNNYWKKYISNTVESTEEALFLLIYLCRKNNWNLIFKPHPGNPVPKSKYLEDIIIVLDMEIDRLIELSDVIVSISSAVDYKVLIYGKPLVQLGITSLRGKGCTYTVSGKEMLEEQMFLALENGMTKVQTENFDHLLQILLQRYLWDDMSERSIRYGLTVEQDFI